MIHEDRVYGKQEIKDSLILSILKTPEMQRLKGVNQYGVWKYVTPWMTTTRFEHCLGVYFLLKRFGASREEQIAGLIHDIGHTAFSHVYDHVVGRTEEQDSNDVVQAKIVANSDIRKFLSKEGISTDFILNHLNFPLLEKKLPDLCADRIDYILRDTLSYGITDKEEIPTILASLNTEKSKIFFTDIDNAKKLALRLMIMDKEYYRSPMHNALYTLAGEAMRIALNKKIITDKDFFDTDEFLMEKLMRSNVGEVINRLKMINPNLKVKEDQNDYDFFIKIKFRYIDPFVLINQKMVRLSNVDEDIKKTLEQARKKQSRGNYIKIISH